MQRGVTRADFALVRGIQRGCSGADHAIFNADRRVVQCVNAADHVDRIVLRAAFGDSSLTDHGERLAETVVISRRSGTVSVAFGKRLRFVACRTVFAKHFFGEDTARDRDARASAVCKVARAVCVKIAALDGEISAAVDDAVETFAVSIVSLPWFSMAETAALPV